LAPYNPGYNPTNYPSYPINSNNCERKRCNSCENKPNQKSGGTISKGITIVINNNNDRNNENCCGGQGMMPFSPLPPMPGATNSNPDSNTPPADSPVSALKNLAFSRARKLLGVAVGKFKNYADGKLKGYLNKKKTQNQKKVIKDQKEHQEEQVADHHQEDK